MSDVPRRLVHARAPIRMNDLGGWTDTWFAGSGRVLNVAVHPGVEVQIEAGPNPGRRRDRVLLRIENYGEVLRLDPDRPGRGPHGLLQQAVGRLPVGRETALQIRLYSPIPAGISTGTSAAVCVALLGALNELRSRTLSWRELARLAHRVETEDLGQQSGIQDQIAAAHGGITDIVMTRYPGARIRAARVSPAVVRELDRRLLLVYLGRPHRSSSMHERVIAGLEAGGTHVRILRRLAALAAEGCAAIESGDLDGYGRTMIRNHEGQRDLYAGLVSATADRVAALAARSGALGWKVNGAGGTGGSMTVLAPADDDRRRRLVRDLGALGGGIRVIPTAFSPAGVEAWTTAPDQGPGRFKGFRGRRV